MLKRMAMRVAIAMLLIIGQFANASSGALFNVTATGTPGNVSLTLCLNGIGILSCQNYTVSALNVIISPTVPNHVYPSIGIQINTPGYTLGNLGLVCAVNSNGYCLFSASQSQPKTLSLVVSGALTLSPTTLPNTTTSDAYNQTITASGGISPYQYTVISGALPPGLSLSIDGVISGTATLDGTYSFTISATDSNTPSAKTGAQAYTLQVSSGNTTTVLSSSPNPSVYAQSVIFTAVVSPNSATGTVTFFDGETTLGSGTLSHGVATYTTSSLTAGTHNMVATYGGDSNFDGSTSNTVNQTVTQATQATLTAVATPSNIDYEGMSTLSITGGSGTGAVTYTVASGSSDCSISGSTLTGIGVGSCTVTATKAADTDYQAITSSPITVTVAQLAQTITFTSVAPTNALVGGSTYTPTATSTSGLSVTITVDSSSSSVCSISGGVVSFTGAGTCTLDANQLGNAIYSAATEVQQAVTVHSTTPTTTVVYSSINPRARNLSVTLSAKISSDNGVPGAGTVGFTANGTSISGCTAQSLTSGIATCGTSFSTTGTKTIVANYTGASGFADSMSTFSQSVVTSVVSTVPAAPQYVTAIPGEAQVTVNWYPPANTGGVAITSYKVSYGTTASNTFTTAACTNTSTNLSCVISGLTDGTPYTFTVGAANSKNTGAVPTGLTAFSSSVAPGAVLTASPSNLALSGLVGGAARTITITNNSGSDVAIASISAPSPSLPSDATVNTSQINACASGVELTANGGFCTITIAPGSNATSTCTLGTVPTPSVITVTDNNNDTVTAHVVIVDYGCQYQEGYLFSIDDTTPLTSSIGGKVVALNDQVSLVYWLFGVSNFWGINDVSTIAIPSPQPGSGPQPPVGQLNCNSVNDGACATNNVFFIVGPRSDYAVGLCKATIDGYTDWYLPSVCELGPFGFSGLSGSYPKYANSQSCIAGSTNIQNQLASTGIVTNFAAIKYWSSTQDSSVSTNFAWYQQLAAVDGFQAINSKAENDIAGARCSRSLTL